MAMVMNMPKLGMTMEEGTVQIWFKGEGDRLEQGEPLLSVLTDKIDIEVEAPMSGVLRKILVPAGTTVPINTPIAIIAAAGEDISGVLADMPPSADPVDAVAGVDGPPGSGAGVLFQEPSAVPAGEEKVRATPVARRLAAEQGLDLASIPGSGPRGRVTRADVEAFAAGLAAPAGPVAPLAGDPGPRELAVVPPAVPPAAREPGVVAPSGAGPVVAGAAGTVPAVATATGTVPAAAAAPPLPATAAAPGTVQRIPLSPMRRVIGQRMAASAFTAPHVTLTTEADVTDLVALRRALHEESQRRGGPGITYTDLFVRIVARALQDHPHLNGRLENDTIVLEPDAHVGIAVALADGLVVPVIRHAGRLGLAAIAGERHRLVQAARADALSPDDVHGGTFTITNLGQYEIDAFTPIINPPQTAILGLGRIVAKPAVYEGQVAVRSMMVLSLSFDHRVVDGAPAAAFVQRIKQLAERPELLHL